MNISTSARLTGLSLVVAAGFAQAALAQNTATQTDSPKTEAQRMKEMQKQTAYSQNKSGQSNMATDFRSCASLNGRDVVNFSDEAVGDISDMIIDRGTGRVVYAVIQTGTVLGMGGRTVTVPYEQLQWNASKERYVLNSTTDQLRMYPAFSAEEWKNLSTSSPSERTQIIPNANNSNSGLPGNRNPGQSTSGSAEYDQARTKADRPSNAVNNTTGNTTNNTTNTTTTTTRSTNDARTTPTSSETYTPGTPGTPDGADPNNTRDSKHAQESKTAQDSKTNQDWKNNQDSKTVQNTKTTQDWKNNQDQAASPARTQDNRSVDSGNNISAVPGQLNPGQSAAGGSQTYQESTGADPKFADWMWTRSSNTRSEPYMSQWDLGQKQRIEGEIVSVNRESSINDSTVVEVKAQDGSTKKVVLGPSWYLSGSDASLNRGDRISLEVVPVNVATKAQVNGRDIALRNTSDGTTEWSGKSFKSGGQSYSAPYYRHVLLSTLKEARLDCRGTVCGRVDDVVIEANSGTIAFLSIDPNENFMGIADTKRLVPYAVANVGMDGTVRLDVSKDMVLASTKTPSDLSTINGQTDSIHSAYKVAAPSYQRWNDDSYNTNQNRRDHRFNENGTRRTDAEVDPR